MTSKHKKTAVISLLVLGIVFFVFLVSIFSNSFKLGTFYPKYSSLRSDPFGTKMLYKSFKQLPEITVTQRIKSFTPLAGKNQTLLVLGYSPISHTGKQERERRTNFVKNGGRLIIALQPIKRIKITHKKFTDISEDSSDEEEEKSEKEEKKVEEEKKEEEDQFSSTFFDVPIASFSSTNQVDSSARSKEVSNPELPWHATHYFDLTDLPKWKIICLYKNKPAIIERKIGSGSVLLLSDSYLFSNEALVSNRCPEFLLHVVGSSSEIIFDETHLGINKKDSISLLLKRYRLQGFFVGLFLLFLLFLWKNSISFIPAPPEEETDQPVTGATSQEGFIRLLTRHIPIQSLLETMIKEWKKSAADNPKTKHKAKEIDAYFNLLKSAEKKPSIVILYNQLTEWINQRK